MHICEDHFVAEIIDPNTGEVLPDGTKGELVFTSLTKEAFPLLRYRTRDICVLDRSPCPCGRTHVRMAANYQIIVDRVNNSDTLDVQVEMTPELFSDTVTEVSGRERELVDALKSMLGIKAEVHLVAPKSITRSEGKAVRVIDKRKLV